jgi:hypothetical protein
LQKLNYLPELKSKNEKILEGDYRPFGVVSGKIK